MEIRWESAAGPDEDSEAAKAPKSQRYWDKHKIPKPDYALTDAEFAASRALGSRISSSTGQLLAFCIMLIIAAILFIIKRPNSDYGRTSDPGTRLGSGGEVSSSWAFPARTTNEKDIVEEARKARLARFDQVKQE